MLIAGLQKNSMVDYRGKVAAVVFVPFCNFDCFYCHNRMILETNPSKLKYKPIDNEEFFTFLEKRKGLLHGVVVTGGEPTLHRDLPEFIEKVRNMGYPVKLDTNGYVPDVIEDLLARGLLDYIAMDVKGPPEKYNEISGIKADTGRLEKSISIIMQSGIDYEFRTTVPPGFTLEDVEGVMRMVNGCRRFVLQQFRRPPAPYDARDLRNLMNPLTKSFFIDALAICEKSAGSVEVRGIDI